MIVDYRSLTEFCKAFEYRNMANCLLAMADSGNKHTKNGSLHARSSHKRQANCAPSQPPSLSCSSLPASAVDIVILVLVLGACGFLFTPYVKYVCTEVVAFTLILLGEVVYQNPIAYISESLLMFVLVVGGCELYRYKARKCDNPRCRGLRKAAEFDIQIESERDVKSLSSSSSALPSLPSPSLSSFPQEVPLKGSAELGRDNKELEAELKRMAPPNGRAVLVVRSPCGCLATRMEVWGTKKPRKSKK